MTIEDRVAFIEAFLWGGGPGGGFGDLDPPPGPAVSQDIDRIYRILSKVVETQRTLVPETQRAEMDILLLEIDERLASAEMRRKPRGGIATV